MTAQHADPPEIAPPVAAVPDPVVRINSNPDSGGLKPFELAYLGPDGNEIVETLRIRLKPPFAVYRRWEDLRTATESKLPSVANAAAIRFFRVGMPVDDANRLIALIEGDEDDVGSVTGDAIGDVIELIRANAYDTPNPPVPRSPGSSNGPGSTGRSSPAKKSSRARKSTTSRRTKG